MQSKGRNECVESRFHLPVEASHRIYEPEGSFYVSPALEHQPRGWGTFMYPPVSVETRQEMICILDEWVLNGLILKKLPSHSMESELSSPLVRQLIIEQCLACSVTLRLIHSTMLKVRYTVKLLAIKVERIRKRQITLTHGVLLWNVMCVALAAERQSSKRRSHFIRGEQKQTRGDSWPWRSSRIH